MKVISKLTIAQLAVLGQIHSAAASHERQARSDKNLRSDPQKRLNGKEQARSAAAINMEAWESFISSSISAPMRPTPSKKPNPVPSPSAPTPTDCCNLPAGSREKQLFDLYSTVSDPKDIVTAGTPQFKAFKWILEEDEFCVCPLDAGCELVQRYVMAVYYYSTKGEGWTNCGAGSATCDPTETKQRSGCYPGAAEPWLSNNPSCDWCGDNCDDPVNPTCITQISLDNITQAGTIPFELQNITYLWYFSNEDGAITNTIPEQLGNLKNLSFFDVNFQNIEGTIPETFYSLDNLYTLDVNDNFLTGSISSGICDLKKMSLVQLGNDKDGANKFSGTEIPSCVGDLPALKVFDVTGLGLTGPLPAFKNPNLAFLDVEKNNFSGNLDGTNWNDLSNLQTLVLGDNALITGTIPESIGGIDVLSLADFTGMGLTGTMPSAICGLRDKALEFLQTDCGGVPPKVVCEFPTCCTFCQYKFSKSLLLLFVG
jgi:hypothetical protein